jgi:hypothetical protein
LVVVIIDALSVRLTGVDVNELLSGGTGHFGERTSWRLEATVTIRIYSKR